MKRRRILLLLALAVVATAAGFVLFSPRGPKDPIYQGKRLSKWIQEAMPVRGRQTEFDRERTNAACHAIKAIGTNAIPFLVSEFVRPDSKWRSSFNRWASKHPAIRFRFSDCQAKVLAAGYALQVLGRDAAPALPTLAEYLGDRRLGRTAATVMGSAQDLAIPYFLKAIASPDALAADNAGTGIAYQIRDAESAISSLIQMLQHTNVWTRRNAVWTLGHRWEAEPIVPALTRSLTDPDPGVQFNAAHALAEKGKSALPAVPALLRLMTNSDRDVALAASNAVAQIDPAALPPREP